MAKQPQLLRGLLVVCLLLALLAQPANAMRVVQTDSEWQTNQEIPDTYSLVAENALFELHANPESLAIKIVDKRSGYVWHSNLDEVGEDDRLNRTWTAFASSGISIDYLDQKAISERASITNAERTIEFTTTGAGFEAAVTFTEASISLTLIVSLEENGVSVEVPFQSIVEGDPAFKLGMLYVYPFFGAARDDEIPGYMFFPDGSGTLVRFSSDTKAKNMFYGRYYGADLGMISVLPYDPTINRAFRLSIPVIGMVHGEKENAYISVVEKGAPYGEVHLHPAGVTTNFSFIYNAFIYNESYFQATNRSGAGVTTLQQTTNAFDVKIHYRFLTGPDGDYVGMARSYQQYLLDNNTLRKEVEAGGTIGIRLEFLGGEKERVLLWNRIIPMTTIPQMADILNDLPVAKPEVIFYGWQPGGASSMPPKTVKIDGTLGTVAQLREFADQVSAGGGHFSLYLDPQAALRGESGYSPRNELAMSITNSNLIGYNRYKVNYYFNTASLKDRFATFAADLSAELNAGLALDGLGGNLYSDFKRNNLLNRADAVQAYQDMLAQSGVRSAFYLPNDYVFNFMRAYFDVPLSSSGYIYATEVVPFLQIVLSGYIPYYGPVMNFSSNPRDDLLRHADYGVFPSYFLSHDVTAKIMNTPSTWIYTSSYSQWEQEIKQNYEWLNNLLGPVAGHSIIAREALARDVFATTYANGKQIITNYSSQPFTAGSVTVESKDAVITEVTP